MNKMVINKILFITLSNLGDVILTLPALDYLRENFPQSEITVMAGPRPKEIFEGNPNIDKLIIYDKYSRLREKIRLFNGLKKENFDLVVDLRNTFYGALLPARYRTSPFLRIPRNIRHMSERNLYRLQKALEIKEQLPVIRKASLSNFNDPDYINSLLAQHGITVQDKIILVSAGTGGDTRRWAAEKFIRLCAELAKDFKVILVGSNAYQQSAQNIYQNCAAAGLHNFCGLTNLRQFVSLLEKASLTITCDTGTLQLASYLNKPVIALFGPSDEYRYGPWSEEHSVVTKEIFCRPCKDAHCLYKNVQCMSLIRVEDVLRQVEIITREHSPTAEETRNQRNNFKRILIVRTDRIGDVLLSTPVIKALRDNFPNAYIAMMVSPYAKDIVEGNPYLDDVIIYDKDNKHKSWQRSFKFAQNLKKKKFDLAVILHPTNRAHLVTFFAGIRRRIGYNRKCSLLLTDRIKHIKQRGEKHELEYNLDLLYYLGIEPRDKNLFLPIKPESEIWAQDLLKQEGIQEADRLLAIHPAASCKSKIWPVERFGETAEKLAEKYGFKALLIAGPKDIALANGIAKNMHCPVINLAGKTSVSQLASVLKRCSLFISNDSGPVHIASAVGTPVISIFGRNQAGLSPKRWGPLGLKDRIIHKEFGCIECLAHNCVKEFACLKAITVNDVVAAADSILLKPPINTS